MRADERHLRQRVDPDAVRERQVRQQQQTVDVKHERAERALPEHDEHRFERARQSPVTRQHHVRHRQGDRQVQQTANTKIAQREVALV